MSVIDSGFGPGFGAPPSEDLGRTPPQDLAAEQSVLGGMLLSKDAIADVVEVLRGNDFYRPAHELVYEAVLDLYGRGEPADAVTVSDELTKRGELGRVGGAAYLHTLISSVPTAANAGYYADIVRERAILRRLVDAGTRIVQLGYATDGGDVDALVNEAQAEVYAVTERRASEDYVPLSAVIESTIEEIEASEGRGDDMVGVPTGFSELDQLTNGLHPGQMIVIAARPAIGKALALDTPLPTPTGWTTMGEVVVGDELIAADGTVTRVVAATDVLEGRPCFEVVFDDGATIVADAWHQWATRDREGTLAIRTTEEIGATLRSRRGQRRLNHAVATTAPLRLPARHLAVHPYVFGVWLAGGSTDPEVAMRVEGHDPDGGMAALLGMLGTRTIPRPYLRADETQRRDLLAGVLDAIGSINRLGGVQLSGTDPDLAAGVEELLVSLGYRSALTEAEQGTGKVRRWTIGFITTDEVFQHPGKNIEHKERSVGGTVNLRYVAQVRRVDSVPVRCVQIDHPDHLYLAGREMVPTHNSTVALDIARSASIKNAMTAVIFSLEMTRTEITMRLLSAEASVSLQNMRKGTMREDDWAKLARTMGRVNEAPLFIDDSPNMSLMEIRAKCRRLKQRHDLKLVIIDYLQLMSSGKRVESRQQEVAEFSRALKLLAKELEVPVIAVSQLNRGPEQRTDKKPALSDLRESGCLTADTRVLRADTGVEVPLGELFEAGARDVPVWALDESLRYVRRHLTHVFSTGVKPVFRVRLASGKAVRATANHPMLGAGGWVPVGELSVGDRIGVPRHVPGPAAVAGWEDHEVVLLGQLLGAGSWTRGPVRYAGGDPAGQAAVSAAAGGFGAVAVPEAGPMPGGLRLSDPDGALGRWLDRLGLTGRRRHELLVPAGVAGLPKPQIGTFLRHLWCAAGEVAVRRDGSGGRVALRSTSPDLLQDVSRLLLRFGISTRLRASSRSGFRPVGTLEIDGVDSQRRFLQEIGVVGGYEAAARTLLTAVRAQSSGSRPVPTPVVDGVTDVLLAAGTGVVPERLARVAEVLGCANLDLEAVNDVLWDTVVAIDPDGVEEVFDATVLGTHNFIANGIVVHNSIEQDADMVILLHREDAYEKESPRAGEADFIVAKHRNGPTATLVMAFQGHYSRFVDMAHEGY